MCQISISVPNFVEIVEPWPRYVSFNIILVRLENAYLRPFLGFFWAHFPQMMSLIVLTPKRPILG